MPRAIEPVAIAILAKAPIPGLAKTRLIPAIGAHAAAFLHERLTERTAQIACEANVGPVRLWAAPDTTHTMFHDLCGRLPIALAPQPEGDLGQRILAAFEAANGPALVIGTDCPVLTADHLRLSADALRGRHQAVVIPAEDGGYVLIGLREPHPALFNAMPWSTDRVMAETHLRLVRAGLSTSELPSLWDIDREADLERARREGLTGLLD